MNKKLRVIASLIAVSVLTAGSAAAAGLVAAGWDFSQYQGSESLTPFTNTLPANYSFLDPTFNAGTAANGIGTLYFDGSFGSTNTLTDFLPTAGTMNCERLPIGGTLQPEGCAPPNVDGPVRSNRNEPWTLVPGVAFDAHTVLRAEGQAHQNLLAMTASNNVSVVFRANLGAGNSGNTWGVSFGGKTVSGGGDDGGTLGCDPVGASECSSSVTVEFSTNGSSYSSFGSVQLTSADTRYDVPLAVTASQNGYVRLGLAPGSGGALPMIDNVAITSLPEAGSSLMLLAGVLGLLALPRRRA